jgi:hypothetical protein
MFYAHTMSPGPQCTILEMNHQDMDRGLHNQLIFCKITQLPWHICMDGSMSIQPIRNDPIMGGVIQRTVITAPTNWLLLVPIGVSVLYHLYCAFWSNDIRHIRDKHLVIIWTIFALPLSLNQRKTAVYRSRVRTLPGA